MQGLLLTLLLVPAFWALVVRPQQKRQRAHLNTVSTLAVGERVMTVGGIIGTLTEVQDETVRVLVAPSVELELGRTFVRQRIDDDVASDHEVAAATDAGPRAGDDLEEHVNLVKPAAPQASNDGGPA